MDFSGSEAGRFLSGGNDGQVLLWAPVPGGHGGGGELVTLTQLVIRMDVMVDVDGC